MVNPSKTMTYNFVNELGNEINMFVKKDSDGITIAATGPDSTVEHTWTRKEALLMTEMVLWCVEGEPEDITDD